MADDILCFLMLLLAAITKESSLYIAAGLFAIAGHLGRAR